MKPREPLLSDNSRRVLAARYLIKRPDGTCIETPGALFDRVARAVASAEIALGATAARADEIARQFFDALADGVFMPNSPTLMNAGRELGMLSACFVLPVPDSVAGIFESVKDAALIQKAGGGTGFAFDRLRPTGDYIATSGGLTSGPISFWRVFSEATNAIQQGAFRRGANMGMMHIAHPDILKFITAKSRLGAFENFNISIKVGDDFLADLERAPRRPHVVVNPRTKARYYLPRGLGVSDYTLADLAAAPAASAGGDTAGPTASACYTIGDVWRLIAACAHASGEPGLCFIDRVNADNPTPLLGRIEATNPCGEQPLLDYEACNLGSINLAKFIHAGAFDEDGFRSAVRLGVRFLDDVIEVNNYMVEAIAGICRANRKIGLGVMGLADALMLLGIPYDSDAALAWADRAARALTEEALAASEALAGARGAFPNWPGSRWDTVHHRKLRNAAVTTVAPTGTISPGLPPAGAGWAGTAGGQPGLPRGDGAARALARGLGRPPGRVYAAGGDTRHPRRRAAGVRDGP
jgi:ribonucleoside-diphosphate reductase alpha chain